MNGWLVYKINPCAAAWPHKKSRSKPYKACSDMAEMERFELSRAVTRLPHFECGPFNHLGTSPDLIQAWFRTPPGGQPMIAEA